MLSPSHLSLITYTYGISPELKNEVLRRVSGVNHLVSSESALMERMDMVMKFLRLFKTEKGSECQSSLSDATGLTPGTEEKSLSGSPVGSPYNGDVNQGVSVTPRASRRPIIQSSLSSPSTSARLAPTSSNLSTNSTHSTHSVHSPISALPSFLKWRELQKYEEETKATPITPITPSTPSTSSTPFTPPEYGAGIMRTFFTPSPPLTPGTPSTPLTPTTVAWDTRVTAPETFNTYERVDTTVTSNAATTSKARVRSKRKRSFGEPVPRKNKKMATKDSPKKEDTRVAVIPVAFGKRELERINMMKRILKVKKIIGLGEVPGRQNSDDPHMPPPFYVPPSLLQPYVMQDRDEGSPFPYSPFSALSPSPSYAMQDRDEGSPFPYSHPFSTLSPSPLPATTAPTELSFGGFRSTMPPNLEERHSEEKVAQESSDLREPLEAIDFKIMELLLRGVPEEAIVNANFQIPEDRASSLNDIIAKSSSVLRDLDSDEFTSNDLSDKELKSYLVTDHQVGSLDNCRLIFKLYAREVIRALQTRREIEKTGLAWEAPVELSKQPDPADFPTTPDGFIDDLAGPDWGRNIYSDSQYF